ncbi:cytoplasmic polyadenylation element-binding protein 1 isoform X1 [Nasonia vitripennis]|uniref:RRM domain-containing protein n=2 Tax=Nasonia vitripennis TaxID=7425 RepID=A0A7M7IS54_NASVI|nr:cytoplasmic polyadenylation element-binding protein 1 isoform X1 [Nasonia vitripennis]
MQRVFFRELGNFQPKGYSSFPRSRKLIDRRTRALAIFSRLVRRGQNARRLSYHYDADKSLVNEMLMESQYRQHQQQQQMETISLDPGTPDQRDHAAHQRENKLQLQQHEREQHLHQLQSINNLLLDLPTPQSLNSYAGSTKGYDLASPTSRTSNGHDITDMSISELFGLGLPRGSLMGAGQKEQVGQADYDAPAYRNYRLKRDRTTTLPNSSIKEQADMNGCYSNSNNMKVPTSPVSVHTPASPGTPGSLYSNSYSYSSVNSSPYASGSFASNEYSKQFASSSPIRSPCYGRPIRGSTPYSDCSSPSAELPAHVFSCNGSRSNSPADSENSVNSVDGPLSNIMNHLSLNSEHRCRPPTDSNAYFRACEETYFPLNQQQQQHQHQVAAHGHPYNNHNQQHHFFGDHSIRQADRARNCCLQPPTSPITSDPPTHLSLDRVARYHRHAAAASDANYTWSGTLPQKNQKAIGYSSKVFLGGVPWDITESTLISTFKQFGHIRIEWPGKDQATSQPKGYVYIIFESEKQVKSLLACCTHDFSNGGSYYYKISSKRMKGKQVQVIPWAINDSNFVKSSSQKLDPEKTVFVGALHGMITATALATIMNDLFGNVIYAGIDTDKHKYPIGSARVTFSRSVSFDEAVNAAFIQVKTTKFTKKLQVDPYIEDAPCSSCYVQQGPYFCRQRSCFKYYCHTCWQWAHNNDSKNWHKPMTRGMKNKQVIGLTPTLGAKRKWSLY